MSEQPRARIYTRQDAVQALRDVDSAPQELQHILETAPDVIIRHSEDDEILSLVLDACDSVQTQRKLGIYNVSWKVLLAVVSSPCVSLETYRKGTLFMITQLQHAALSHDWSEPKSIKLVAFFASHLVSAVRAHPRFFLLASTEVLPPLVELFFALSFTISMSDRDDAAVRPLHDQLLKRIGVILENVGTAAVALDREAADVEAQEEEEEEEAAATPRCEAVLSVLHHCVGESAATQLSEESGNACASSVVTSVAALSCVLHTIRGLLSDETRTLESHALIALYTLLQFLPGIQPMHAADDSLSSLLGRIHELSSTLPPHALWQPLEDEEAAAAAGANGGGHHASMHMLWADSVRDALRVLYNRSTGSCSVPPLASIPALLHVAASPHVSNAAVLTTIQKHFVASLPAAEVRPACRSGARHLLSVGCAMQTEELSAPQCAVMATLSAVVGGICAAHVGTAPSMLCGPSQRSGLLCVAMADLCYHSITNAGELESVLPTQTATSEILLEVKTLLQGVKESTGGDVFALTVLRVAPALQRLRRSVTIVGESSEGAAQLQAAYASLRTDLSACTTVLQSAAAQPGSHAVAIAVCLAAAAWLREIAHVPLSADDEVLKACIRRWVDLSFPSFLTEDSQSSLYPLLRFNAARSLLVFAQNNTDVGMDQLRLSELAVSSLMALLQPTASEALSTDSADAHRQQQLWWWSERLEREGQWQASCDALPESGCSPSHQTQTQVAQTQQVAAELLEGLRMCQHQLELFLAMAGSQEGRGGVELSEVRTVIASLEQRSRQSLLGSHFSGDGSSPISQSVTEGEGASRATTATQPLLSSTAVSSSSVSHEVIDVD